MAWTIAERGFPGKPQPGLRNTINSQVTTIVMASMTLSSISGAGVSESNDDFRIWQKRTWRDVRVESVMRFKADIGEMNIAPVQASDAQSRPADGPGE